MRILAVLALAVHARADGAYNQILYLNAVSFRYRRA
jgi:uncharacterized membrane protein